MIDLLIVAGYFTFLLGVGWRARGGGHDSYWVAARRYGVLSVAASLVATIFGASSTVGIIGLGYERGLTGAWWSLIGGMALVPFALLLASRVRDLEVYTLPDILHRTYGRGVAMAGAGVIAVAWCGVVAAQIVAGAFLLASVLSVGLEGAMIAITVIFVLYTLWGGQLSVIRTDSWQILLFVGALVATLVLVLRTGPAGGNVLAGLPAGHLAFPTSPGFGPYQLLVFYPLIVGMPYLVGPDIYSRVFCARSGGVAKKASLLAALVVIPLSLLLALLGLLIRAQIPGLVPEAALPAALTALAPTGIKGLIVVGVLGAIMSSADTTLISASTILSLNVVSPLLRIQRRAELRLTRAFVVLLGILAWGVATFQEGIIASLLLAYTVFVGGIALPLLASFWRDRLGVTAKGALWGVIVGGSTALFTGMRGGDLFKAVVGEAGAGLLERVLGPEAPSILPLILSGFALFGVSWLFGGGGGSSEIKKA